MSTPEQRVEALRSQLGYPLKQKDPSGSRFWYLRPGEDEEEAEYTCPIAVGFYSELNEMPQQMVASFFTEDEQQEIRGHYTNRVIPDQPVMYLLLPEKEYRGTVAMILPGETKLRQRQIEPFAWDSEDFQARLGRLHQETLVRTNRMQKSALSVVPLVEWVFYKPITTARALAQQLAAVSCKIEKAIPAIYNSESDDGYLRTLLQSFQKELLPSLELKAEDYSFADIYAQTISYGLFTARVFSHTIDERKRDELDSLKRKETDFNRQNAWEFLPETNPFLQRLFQDVSQQSIKRLGDDLGDCISEIFSILRAARMQAILQDFRSKMNQEDIVIRFYEDFLKAYKPGLKDRRGVYYTPEAVVSYMVRSVDILLKQKFDKPLGLADPEVMILDPACGTGTFLLWIFKLIRQRFEDNPAPLVDGLEDKSWSNYVKERLLPRVFGFELLMAPYAIAHLKLGLFLEETGYQFSSGKRLGVYLTNALEQSTQDKPQIPFEEFIAAEGAAALRVKRDEPLMVVIGNPPYSVSSANQGKWIVDLIEIYKKNVRSEEVQIQALSNDYIKFIRFAQWQIEKSEKGIVALITGNGYKSGPLFRDMRANLVEAFNEIYMLDLHGSIRWGESSPDGRKDGNVFDIQQGVATLLMLKTDSDRSKRIVNGLNIWGSREEKYKQLRQEDVNTSNWIELNPQKPYYYFAYSSDLEEDRRKEYNIGWSVPDIFGTGNRRKDQNRVWGTGFATRHDKFAIGITSSEVVEKIEEFASSEKPPEELRAKFKLCTTSHWRMSESKSRLSSISVPEHIRKILYRPFDYRYTAYIRDVVLEPRTEFMQYLFNEVDTSNIALIVSRIINGEEPNHFFVSDIPVEKIFLSNKTSNNAFVFPLYTQNMNKSQDSILGDERRPNLSQKFLSYLKETIGFMPSPELILSYIYSVVHSRVYRTRYSDFLKQDFPRIQFTQDKNLLDLIGN